MLDHFYRLNDKTKKHHLDLPAGISCVWRSLNVDTTENLLARRASFMIIPDVTKALSLSHLPIIYNFHIICIKYHLNSDGHAKLRCIIHLKMFSDKQTTPTDRQKGVRVRLLVCGLISKQRAAGLKGDQAGFSSLHQGLGKAQLQPSGVFTTISLHRAQQGPVTDRAPASSSGARLFAQWITFLKHEREEQFCTRNITC